MSLKKCGAICTLITSLLLPGCATIKGTLGGGISYPHETIDNTLSAHKLPKDKFLLAFYIPVGLVYTTILIPQGIIKGTFHGIKADLYFAEHGKYPESYESMRPWVTKYED